MRPQITQSTIDHIVSTIVGRFNPHRIVLFGSRARGDNRLDSDLDLMIEMDVEAGIEGRERVRRIHRIFDPYPCAMDIIVYTPEEIAARKSAAASLVSTILREGTVLYERER
jgi:predicted nucleotidyltransferase